MRGTKRETMGHGCFIPDRVFEHNDFKNLSSAAKCLLMALAQQYRKTKRGGNNGNLTVAYSVVGSYVGTQKTITKAKNELIDAGLIITTKQPARRNGRAVFDTGLYALTWLNVDDCYKNGELVALDVNASIAPVRPLWGCHSINP